MPDFINYTAVSSPRGQAASKTISFSGPLGEYLRNLESKTQEEKSEVSEAPSSQASFRWGSGGVQEQPYTVSTETASQGVVSQPQPSGNQNVVSWALSKVGSPYVWGAKGTNNTYDCSGLVYAAYKANGINVPGSTAGWLSSGKQTVGKYDGQPGDVIITGSTNSPSGRHARLITKNLGNGKYECVEAKGKNYGVVTSTYTIDNNLKNIYRAKQGLKLIKKNRHE